MIVLLATLLALGQPQVVSEKPPCAKVCQFKSNKSSLINTKQKDFGQITEAYRPYFVCYRDAVSTYSMFWEAGKEVENIKFADELSWTTCEKERSLAEGRAEEIAKVVFSKKSPVEITSGIRKYRSGLAFTIQLLHYQKIGKLPYFTQYARRFPNAQD